MGAGAKDRHRWRRSWSVAAKTAIVAESNVPGAMVNVVARRHGLNPSQLCQWRREHAQSTCRTVEVRPAFAPVIVEDRPAARAATHPETGEIEIARGEVTVRVRGGVDPALLVIVLQALAGLS